MTTGSGSSFQLTRLAAKYNEMRTNGQLLSNRHAVEIIDDRIVDLAARIDLEEAPERMGKIFELWQEFKHEMYTNNNPAKALTIRNVMDSVFEAVYHDYKAWDQILGALDLRRKMVESEVKVLKEIRGIISVEDAYELSAKLLASMIKILGDDPHKLKQVQYEFAKIIGEVSDDVATVDVEPDKGSGGEGGSE